MLQAALFLGNIILLLLLFVESIRKAILKAVIAGLQEIPAIRELIQGHLRTEVRKILKDDLKVKTDFEYVMEIPPEGESNEILLSKLEELKTTRTDKMFAYVYSEAREVLGEALNKIQEESSRQFTEEGALSDSDRDSNVLEVARQFGEAFMHENALNPTLFRALRKFEVEVVAMTASMLHGDSSVRGNVTSGGTESVLMAVKTYRDLAKKRWPHITNPKIIAPTTVHPAFHKAAHYFSLEMCLVPIDPGTFQPKIEDFRKAIDSSTVLLVASAPQYCHGIVDPIPEISDLALEFGLPCHVDACFGGFMLPWVQQLGYEVPDFDFKNPGVTSVSADLHKYGFAPKGASVIVYRNSEIRKHQLYAYSGWPGGLFGSPTMAGTRPGGHLASSWVTLRSLGQNGYLRIAKDLMELTKFWIEGIKNTDGLCILGKPQMSCFAVGSDDKEINIFVVAELMEEKGWNMERESNPDCLHCTILPQHLKHKTKFVEDLKESVEKIRREKLKPKGLAAVYGMIAKVPSESLIEDFLLEFFNEIYS